MTCPERKTVCSKVHTIMHTDAREDGINFRGKYERIWLELTDDGLMAEFYKAFWNIVSNLMVETLNYSYDHGELLNSQKRAIITLIEKKKR